MKKTSRRSLGRQLTPAKAAVPVASLAMNTGAEGPTAQQNLPAIRNNFYHQDTPPPIEIIDGSLIVESDEQFNESNPSRFLYQGIARPKIAHIRVIQDNGDKIYEDLNADSSVIQIVWINEDKNATGNVIITDGNVFQIDSDKTLKHSPVKKRRSHRYDHQGGGGKRIRIESIEITNPRGGTTKFIATKTGTGDNFISDEFRLLIWRE
ncbi:MAG: hypothetical protein QOH41_4242 [Blastocatellia bacterium]|jgi:hypothetical protein|nr:hypothetical protein [Blastocatellia bacterium]